MMDKQPKLYDITESGVTRLETFPAFLEGIASVYGNRPAITRFTRKRESVTLTYRELRDKAAWLRSAMTARGMNRKTVAIAAENSPEWLLTYFAAVSCGCAVACIDIEQSPKSICRMIASTGAEVMFVTPSVLSMGDGTASERGNLKVVTFGECSEPGAEVWEDLLEEGKETIMREGNCPYPSNIDPDSPAEIVFTSGTTGEPKAVVLSQRAVLENFQSAARRVDMYRSVYTSLPFYHSYGLNNAALVPLVEGAHLYINGNLKTSLRDLWLADPDTVFVVPLIAEAMYAQIINGIREEEGEEFLSKLGAGNRFSKRLRRAMMKKQIDEVRRKHCGNLRQLVSGGAALDSETAVKYENLGIDVLQGYGITECAPLLAVNGNGENRIGTVGRPVDWAKIRIRDGEILVKGPCVMLGYQNDPEETEAAFDEGWFCTGDLGFIDGNGSLILTGRKKNLIVFKNGNKVSPENLEEMIEKIPLVKEVMVYGTANGASSDDIKITAEVYPEPSAAAGMTSYEILGKLQQDIEKVNEDLPFYQQIQRVTVREKEFPKNSLHKIIRR